MDDASPNTAQVRRAHPLATALIERLRDTTNARVLEVGTGNGRNTQALRAAGIHVDTIADGAPVEVQNTQYDAALSTHGLLHGDLTAISGILHAIAASLKPNAPLYATFGSVNDSRYGKGMQIAEHVYAPVEGDERNVPHLFFDEPRLRALLAPDFQIEEVSENNAGKVHWFVRAIRRPR